MRAGCGRSHTRSAGDPDPAPVRRPVHRDPALRDGRGQPVGDQLAPAPARVHGLVRDASDAAALRDHGRERWWEAVSRGFRFAAEPERRLDRGGPRARAGHGERGRRHRRPLARRGRAPPGAAVAAAGRSGQHPDRRHPGRARGGRGGHRAVLAPYVLRKDEPARHATRPRPVGCGCSATRCRLPIRSRPKTRSRDRRCATRIPGRCGATGGSRRTGPARPSRSSATASPSSRCRSSR